MTQIKNIILLIAVYLLKNVMSQECIQPKQSINIRLFKSDSHINGWNNGFYSIFRLNENVDSVYQGSFTGLGLVQTDVHCLDHADYIVSLSQPTAGNKLEIGLEVCDKAFVNVGQAVAISIGGSIGCEVMDKRSEYTIASDKQAHIGAINELLGASGSYFYVPSESPTNSPTNSPTYSPTHSPTSSPTDSPTSSPTDSPTNSPTDSPTSSPTDSPTSSPTNSPTTFPTDYPTYEPSNSPTAIPSFQPTSLPTATPTVAPTVAPTSIPTVSPTSIPTVSPTNSPSNSPTNEPTINPTAIPTTRYPTNSPTIAPTTSPTTAPTTNPTNEPTYFPTKKPSITQYPTFVPTLDPTSEPSKRPTKRPTSKPTKQPSGEPTVSPTKVPSLTDYPTYQPTTATPTNIPTAWPTRLPTSVPTNQPNVAKTFPPTSVPTLQSYPVFAVTTSVTLGGSASDTLDTYSQQAVVNAQAAATNINPKFITFFKSVVISTQRRLIEKNTNIDAVDYFFHKLDSLFQPHRQLVSYNLAVFTNTTIPLIGDYESFQNSPESLYSNIVGNLTESVVSNSFTSILKDASTQLGATQLINSVANNISASAIKVSPPQTLSPTSLPTFRPTHSPTDNYLSSGDISAAVIMSIFGAALIIFGIYYWFIYSGKNANKSDDNFHNPFDEQAGVEVRDATVANNDNQPTRNSYTL